MMAPLFFLSMQDGLIPLIPSPSPAKGEGS